MEIEQAKLYFAPSCGEFLKIQPGTGDNLSAEDVAAGFTDYVIWNRFRVECLDIDGELPVECVDSGMVLIDPSTSSLRDSAQDDTQTKLCGSAQGGDAKGACDARVREGVVLKRVLEQAYGDAATVAIGFFEKIS